MSIPTYEEFMLPLLKLTESGQSFKNREYERLMADQFGLSADEKAELLPGGTQTTYQNRIGWAVTYLVKAKLLQRPARATISITERGLELIRTNPAKIDNKLLNTYSEFKDFQRERSPTAITPPPAAIPPAEIPPLEQLERAYVRLRSSLAGDLIDLILQAPPDFFERLVVEVLVSMGYGGTLQDAGQAIGRSGDGGIDGVIKEDRLGLDSIYVQAKRWANNVQTPEIQKFAGALLGRGANRGVFITSSDFTPGARAYVKSIQTKIVLINGQELADLMIEYGVGVIDEQTYRVKRVDLEYFGE